MQSTFREVVTSPDDETVLRSYVIEEVVLTM
jgi:hypothetical protein